MQEFRHMLWIKIFYIIFFSIPFWEGDTTDDILDIYIWYTMIYKDILKLLSINVGPGQSILFFLETQVFFVTC